MDRVDRNYTVGLSKSIPEVVLFLKRSPSTSNMELRVVSYVSTNTNYVTTANQINNQVPGNVIFEM